MNVLSVREYFYSVVNFFKFTVCEHPTWIGDGECNDVNYNALCNWDGGDCWSNQNPDWNDTCFKYGFLRPFLDESSILIYRGRNQIVTLLQKYNWFLHLDCFNFYFKITYLPRKISNILIIINHFYPHWPWLPFNIE